MKGRGMSEKPAAIPAPQYTMFEALGTCLALAQRALAEVRALARIPGPEGKRGLKGEPGEKGDRGEKGLPGAVGAPGGDAAMPKVCGTWSDAESYAALDIVALNGSSFIARR